jgi:colicin import membrane protein
MARLGVSYEQVKAVADGLVSKGQTPTITAVREGLGTGSPNTIQGHLLKWRGARPNAPSMAIELPSTIIREIHAEIARAADTARAEIQEKLALAEQEAAVLAREGERLETEKEQMEERFTALTQERDVMAGKAAEQGLELERLKKEVERERRAAEEARIEVAQARLTIEAQGNQLAAQTKTIEQLRDDVKQERSAHNDALREHAAEKATREGLAERLADLLERERGAQHAVLELRVRIDELGQAAQTNAAEFARVTSELKSAQQALAEAREQIFKGDVSNTKESPRKGRAEGQKRDPAPPK